MFKKLISLLILLIVAGCATEKPAPVVYRQIPIELPPDPIPATSRITNESLPADVMKAWISTAADYRGWNIAVRKLIENSR